LAWLLLAISLTSVLYAVKEAQWKLRIWSNATKQNKDELIIGLMSELPNFGASEWFRNTSRRVQFEISVSDPDTLLEQAAVLKQYVEENDLGAGAVTAEAKTGVNFAGTQFDRLKERGATISGMFGNLVCQASGMNLLMMQAEYYANSGQIDGVESEWHKWLHDEYAVTLKFEIARRNRLVESMKLPGSKLRQRMPDFIAGKSDLLD
jgi:hypothetical protein